MVPAFTGLPLPAGMGGQSDRITYASVWWAKRMKKDHAAALAIGAVLAATLLGSQYGPRPDQPLTVAWYAKLNKPSFTPPGPAFGVAWSLLDGLLCVVGYRLLAAPSSPPRSRAILCWALNLAGLAGYPWIFFGRKRIAGGLAVIAAMWTSAIATVGASSQVDREAAIAGVPLVGWLTFAGLLNEEVWRRNPSS
jgi:benzodiazapine receptor